MPLSSIFSRRAVRAVTAGALLAGSVMVAAVGTTSADGGGLTATMRDNCEATSFNAAIGAGTCVGDGNTTFDQFFAALPTGGHPKWRNQVGSGELKAGQSITVVNRGGEFHSFTEVSKFGGGIVDVINLFGGFTEPAQTVAPFNPATGLVPPGGKTTIGMLAPGTHMFQCMIHPWMRSTITVRTS
jgi:plastocyanin